MTSLAAVLSPLQLGQLTLRNRVVSTSHQTTLVHDHLPTDEFVAYQAGAQRHGLIVLEATARIRKTSRHPT